MSSTGYLGRLALQVAAQLPDDLKDACAVLEIARNLVIRADELASPPVARGAQILELPRVADREGQLALRSKSSPG